jgi:hypothetical protein
MKTHQLNTLLYYARGIFGFFGFFGPLPMFFGPLQIAMVKYLMVLYVGDQKTLEGDQKKQKKQKNTQTTFSRNDVRNLSEYGGDKKTLEGDQKNTKNQKKQK